MEDRSLRTTLVGQDVAMPHMKVGDSVVVIPWQSYDNAVSAGSIVSNVEDLAHSAAALRKSADEA